MKKIFLLINPISGTRSKKGLDKKLVDRLTRLGFDVTIEFTQHAGHATQLARQAVEKGYDAVLACGGDGTINETARAMIGTGVPMGIIPAGSGNGLARHIGIPVDPLLSLDIIAMRHPVDCDYATVNDKPFFCTFGIGFDAAVSDLFAASGKRGRLTYVKSALREFLKYRPQPTRVTADNRQIDEQALLLTVCNANQYGNNAYIAPDASITDGTLDVVFVRAIPRISMPFLSAKMMTGTLRQSRSVVKCKARHIVIERDQPGPAHLDGEPLLNTGTRFEIECHPEGLKLLVPTRKPPFRPYITPLKSIFKDTTISLKKLFR